MSTHFWTALAPTRSWRELLPFRGSQGPAGPRRINIPEILIDRPATVGDAHEIDQDTDYEALAQFLKVHYRTGSGSRHPVYCVSAAELRWYFEQNILYGITVRNVADYNELIGSCITHTLGPLVGPKGPTEISLRLVSELCVRRDRRGEGIASYLLGELVRYLGPKTSYIFLKEGALLPGAGPPLYTGTWVYRRVPKGEALAVRVERVPTLNAVRMAWHFARNRSEQLILNRPEREHPRMTRSYLYTGFRGSILLNVSPAGQKHPDGGKIAYMTGWIEDGELLDQERRKAALAASAAAARDLGAQWIWFDAGAVGPLSNQSTWTTDGLYHWYAFGWTTGSRQNRPFLFI